MSKNLTGYVNIKDIFNYQFIFGTLSKGSFFCIFVQFTTEKNILTKINFHLKAYRGGNSFSFKDRTIKDIHLKDGILQIGCYFKKGSSQLDSVSKDLNFDIKKIEKIYFTTLPKQISKILKEEISKEEIIHTINTQYNQEVDYYENYEQLLEKDSDFIIKSSAAIGGNCITSLMEVTGG
ncbi:hypothetical protein JL193_16225 [Polaribacter batillariae]|uniref:Uncharacterized protein n=1 Tax=Polaribacter batillariae TaxID=2808900 RepID=A0ABX7STL4_9FLAO|nr:hypothetical protein [Polaribacter batillariae]QTD37592.1 hypothetical protein JL193_16225 [Polaribacter batillariae]